MKQNMGKPVFNQEDVNKIIGLTNLNEAKAYAMDKVSNSTANVGNRLKISKFIAEAKNVTQLASTIQNCILAHPSEGLKVL